MNLRTGTGPRVLVLGIGNLVMSDDGVGVKVVQQLQREYRFAKNVEIMDGGTLGLDLLPKLEGIDHLIVVDAVETGRKPGTCRDLPPLRRFSKGLRKSMSTRIGDSPSPRSTSARSLNGLSVFLYRLVASSDSTILA